MSNNDQQLVDHLYNAIFVQQLRCNHFESSGQQPATSIWNRYIDEKKILNATVEQYKNYYKNKIDTLKTELHVLKELNISSYLTYDTEYYINEYNSRMEELEKYIVELDSKSFTQITENTLSSISTTIDLQFPNYLSTPTLLGKL